VEKEEEEDGRVEVGKGWTVEGERRARPENVTITSSFLLTLPMHFLLFVATIVTEVTQMKSIASFHFLPVSPHTRRAPAIKKIKIGRQFRCLPSGKN
jgi:hypothetical protein